MGEKSNKMKIDRQFFLFELNWLCTAVAVPAGAASAVKRWIRGRHFTTIVAIPDAIVNLKVATFDSQYIGSCFFFSKFIFGRPSIWLQLPCYRHHHRYVYLFFTLSLSHHLSWEIEHEWAHIVPLNWVWHYNEMSNNIIINAEKNAENNSRRFTFLRHRDTMLMDTFFVSGAVVLLAILYPGNTTTKWEGKNEDMKWK